MFERRLDKQQGLEQVAEGRGEEKPNQNSYRRGEHRGKKKGTFDLSKGPRGASEMECQKACRPPFKRAKGEKMTEEGGRKKGTWRKTENVVSKGLGTGSKGER